MDRLVMRQLNALPEADRTALLEHARSEDLARLLQAEPTREPATVDRTVELVKSAIAARTTTLSYELLTCHQRLCDQTAGSAPLAGHAFLNNLTARAAALEELKTHCELHGQPMPNVEFLQDALRFAVTAALESGGINPLELIGADLIRLSGPLSTLGLRDCGGMTLYVAELAHIKDCTAAFQQKLAGLAKTLTQRSGPAPMLRALGELEDASSALRRASEAFNPGGVAPAVSSSSATTLDSGVFTSVNLDSAVFTSVLDSSYSVAPARDSDLITGFLNGLGASDRTALAQTLIKPDTQALISSLHVGAQLAGDIRETTMADRFANMARLCEQITTEAAAAQAGSSSKKPEDNAAPALSALSSRDHQQFAAKSLTDPAREALRDAYALQIPTDAAPTLQAGRFDPQQIQAMVNILESPASESERTLVTVGAHNMSRVFVGDAKRRFSFYIHDASSGAEREGSNLTARAMRSPARETSTDTSPPGRALIDWTGPEPDESEMQRLGITPDSARAQQTDTGTLARVVQGYERLVQLCGSEELASTLTTYAHQGIVAGYSVTCALTAAYSLADGAPGHVDSNSSWSDPDAHQRETRVTFSIGENGRPWIDVDDRIEGRAIFTHSSSAKTTYLSSDSYVQAHFRAELGEDGKVRLLEAPSYRFDLRADDFQQKPYPLPTVELLETAAADNVLLTDALKYAEKIGAAPEIHALRAIAAYEREPEPTTAMADAVVSACNNLMRTPERNSILSQPDQLLTQHNLGRMRQTVSLTMVLAVLPGMIRSIRLNQL